MSKAKLYAKILKAKQEFDPVLKDCNNPFFKSKYADLNGILNAVEPALIANGLLLLQPPAGRIVMTQIIDVDTGEMTQSSLDIPESIVKPQDIGAAVTYFRRFTLKALLGITEEDDDGNSLNDKASTTKNTVKVPEPKTEVKLSEIRIPVPTEQHSYKKKLGVAPATTPVNNGAKNNAWDGA